MTINVKFGEKKQTFRVGFDGIVQGIEGKSAYEVAVEQGFKGTEQEWLASLKGEKGEDGYTPIKGVDYFDGKDGYTPIKGVDYVDGVSPTHSWEGTTLTITSASGTSSADLKGEKGEKGEQGIQGVQGVKGDPFQIYKTYQSVDAMYADMDNVPYDKIVLIASNVDDPDNARMYVRTVIGYSYLTDLSGAQGIKGEQGIQGIQGVPGEQGKPGVDGIDGISPTVSVLPIANGHRVTITDANGAKTFDVSNGENGKDGQRGAGWLNTTTGITPYTSTINGQETKYRILLSTLKTEAKVNVVLVGDTIRYGTYLYPIVFVDTDYAYIGDRTNFQGQQGSVGYTPVRGRDYWTEADKAEIKDELKAYSDQMLGDISAALDELHTYAVSLTEVAAQ